MKAAVISCRGLGDGLVSLTLSHNLFINGYEVTTYHPNLFELQSWFKNLKILKTDPVNNILEDYDEIFISYENSFFFNELVSKGKKKYKNKVYVLNPSSSKKNGTQPYYEDAFFKNNISVVDNILLFCKNVLKLQNIEKTNGISCPYILAHRGHKTRVIIHPTSAKESKNWPIKKYVKLALHLKAIGFTPVFVIAKNEQKLVSFVIENGLEIEAFDNLNDLAKYIYESQFMIGNDSGIGHMASSLKIETLSIFRNYRTALLWRPGFYSSKIIYPSRFYPNPSFFRFRDKFWKYLITTNRLLKLFSVNKF